MKIEVVVTVILAVLVSLGGGGCYYPYLAPVSPTPTQPVYESAPGVEVGRAIARQLGVGITLSVDRDQYVLLPPQAVEGVLQAFQPGWSQFDNVTQFRADAKALAPSAAIGIALLGPPEEARYWAVYIDPTLKAWLIDVHSKVILEWNFIAEQGAWVQI